MHLVIMNYDIMISCVFKKNLFTAFCLIDTIINICISGHPLADEVFTGSPGPGASAHQAPVDVGAPRPGLSHR